MVGVLPGERRPITLTNLPEGLAGTLGIRLEDAEGKVVQARTTVGITEFAKGSYRVWITFPTSKGFYVVIADDDDIEAVEEYEVTTDPVAITPGPDNYVPIVQEVANHLRARTKDQFDERGTFTGETRPTEEQVIERIPAGVRKVASHIGIKICEGIDEDTRQSLTDDARDLAALFVATRIEREYYPEQIGSGRSPYKEMVDEYNDGIKTLTEAVAEHCGGGDGASVGGSGPLPSSSFPCPSGIGEEIW